MADQYAKPSKDANRKQNQNPNQRPDQQKQKSGGGYSSWDSTKASR